MLTKVYSCINVNTIVSIIACSKYKFAPLKINKNISISACISVSIYSFP